MKYVLVVWGMLLLLLLGCAKAKENIIEQKALNLLDGTEWKIVSFIYGGTNASRDFDPYTFRFNKNGIVTALRNNTTAATGNWQGDIANKTIQTHFQSAAAPLPLLNATWTITQSTTKSLTANTGTAPDIRELKMEKQ